MISHMKNINLPLMCLYIVQILCMLVCGVEDPNGEAIKKHLARVPDYLWLSEDGITVQARMLDRMF